MPEQNTIRLEKINTVEIKNLWGQYNFKWDLNEDVNILVGINGSGKTTIFRIIESIFNEFDYFEEGEYNYDEESDFMKKMKIRNHNTEVKITFNDGKKVSGNKGVWGGLRYFGQAVKISNINTFDVPVSRSRAERMQKNSVDSDLTLRMRTLLDIELEELIFRKENEDSYTFLDYRFRKMVGVQTKTNEFEKYRKKINDFYALINNYFKDTYKEIREDEMTNGIKFYHTKRDKYISIHNLSAGEKQLLLIFFTIFLQDEQPSVLLLDEPEISLHIIWQQKLIETLRQLNPNCQLIIATHSPGIFGKGWGYKRFKVDELFYD